MYIFQKNNFSKKGFTLIETLVAVSIFSIVLILGVGSILSVSSANQRTQAMRNLSDNLNFATEDITRNIRTGHGYNAANGFLSLIDQNGQTVDYQLNSAGVIVKSTAGQPLVPITSPEVQINDLIFRQVNTPQPRIFMFIQGQAQVGDQLTKFDLQTSVSQRLLQ